MNTPVNFELAKLLKEKGYDEYSKYAIGIIHNDIVSVPPEFGLKENEDVIYGVLCNSRMDEFNSDYISAPTIAEVVMWLYEKHGIWISVSDAGGFGYMIQFIKTDGDSTIEGLYEFNSPTEAYEAAIFYCLTK